MSNLNEQHIDFISGIILKSKIDSIEMKEDLIDHFCCAIENDMKKGLEFEEAYNNAYNNICPGGFDDIQNETIYLLTAKKIKFMRRLLFLSGYLVAIGITTTMFLKLNHLIFGSIALLFTFIATVFIFLPTLFSYLYKKTIIKSFREKLKNIFGFFGIALLVTAISFKLFHWPGYLGILIASLIVINFTFFPFIFYKMYRKSE